MRSSQAVRRRRRGATIVSTLSVFTLLAVGIVYADGSETLGPPPAGFVVQPGTDVIAEGVGLVDGDASFIVSIPSGAEVLQVIAHWSGEYFEADPSGADDTATVNGNLVTGDLIGGPDQRFDYGGDDVVIASYRADVDPGTLNLVAGDNVIEVADLDFAVKSEGFGLMVIIEETTQTGLNQNLLRDGMDRAWSGFDNEPFRTTVPQTWTFAPSSATRTADLHLHVSSVGDERPNEIDITVGGTTETISNPFGDTDGDEWDTVTFPLVIPAGVDTVTAEVKSAGDDNKWVNASLNWIAALLELSPNCTPEPGASSSGGMAHAAFASVPGLDLTVTLADVDVEQDGPGSAGQNENPLAIAVPGDGSIVSAELIQSNTQSENTADAASNTSFAELANVNLLDGLVTADAVVARSFATATELGSDSHTFGSRIEGLAVAGLPLQLDPITQSILPNTEVTIPTIGTLQVMNQDLDRDQVGGFNTASAQMEILRVEIFSDAFPAGTPLAVANGAVISIALAESHASFGLNPCDEPDSYTVSGFGSVLRTDLLPDLTYTSVGPIDPLGGDETAQTFGVGVPGVVSAATAYADTHGGFDGFVASAMTEVGVLDLDVIDGLVIADAIQTDTSVINDGSGSTTVTANTVLANVTVGAINVCDTLGLAEPCSPEPNTPVLSVGVGNIQLIEVIANYQVSDNPLSGAVGIGCADGDTECTVRGLVIQAVNLLDPTNPFTFAVAEAHADAHVPGLPGPPPGPEPFPPVVLPIPCIPNVTCPPDPGAGGGGPLPLPLPCVPGVPIPGCTPILPPLPLPFP